MTDKELQLLAREYAEQDIPLGDPDVTKADRDSMVDTVADYAVEILRWLTKTHCIVSLEKVEEQYMRAEKWLTETDNPKQHHDPIRLIAVGAQSTLESIFGTELFEERSEE